MSNSKATIAGIMKLGNWHEVRPGKWMPDGLYCFKCGKRSKPEDANNLHCPYCGGKLIEVQS